MKGEEVEEGRPKGREIGMEGRRSRGRKEKEKGRITRAGGSLIQQGRQGEGRSIDCAWHC